MNTFVVGIGDSGIESLQELFSRHCRSERRLDIDEARNDIHFASQRHVRFFGRKRTTSPFSLHARRTAMEYALASLSSNDTGATSHHSLAVRHGIHFCSTAPQRDEPQVAVVLALDRYRRAVRDASRSITIFDAHHWWHEVANVQRDDRDWRHRGQHSSASGAVVARAVPDRNAGYQHRRRIIRISLHDMAFCKWPRERPHKRQHCIFGPARTDPTSQSTLKDVS